MLDGRMIHIPPEREGRKGRITAEEMPFMRTPPTRRARALLFPAVVLLSLAASACDIVTADFKSRATGEWRKSYQLAPGGRVEVANINGKIDVTGSSGNTVEIVAEKLARGATPEAAKDALGRVEIREESGASF